MLGFAPINDINLASILSTLGVHYKHDSITDVRKGTGKSILHYPVALIPNVLAPLGGPGGPKRKQSILKLLKSGELAKIDPHHPALDSARALVNREKLLDWLKTGKPQHLVRTDGINRCVYVPTDAVPAEVRLCKTQWKTRDLKLAAAMAVIGVPVCRIVGDEKDHEFYLAAESIALAGERYNGFELAGELFRGTLRKDHPLQWAMQTLKNRERLLDILHNRPSKMLVRKLQSARNASAVITPTEDRKAMDKQLTIAQKHCGTF